MPQDKQAQAKKETQLVIFVIAGEEFGVVINQVREIVRLVDITRLPKAPAFVEGVVNLRGQVIPVIDLAKRLEMPTSPRDNNTRIIVVEMQENVVGMIVDSVMEVLRLPTENIDEVPPLIETEVPEHLIHAVGKLDDRLLILLDLEKVLTHEEVVRMERHIKEISKDKEPPAEE